MAGRIPVYVGAVLQARRFVGDEPFLLLLGDHIYLSRDENGCAVQVVDAYHRSGADAFLGKRDVATALVPTIRSLAQS